jgi:hypothetical protein
VVSYDDLLEYKSGAIKIIKDTEVEEINKVMVLEGCDAIGDIALEEQIEARRSESAVIIMCCFKE